jgi:hypothetical protein
MDNEKDYMDDMMASIVDGDKEEFYSAFKSEIGERIGDRLVDKEINIASDLLNTPEEEN